MEDREQKTEDKRRKVGDGAVSHSSPIHGGSGLLALAKSSKGGLPVRLVRGLRGVTSDNHTPKCRHSSRPVPGFEGSPPSPPPDGSGTSPVQAGEGRVRKTEHCFYAAHLGLRARLQ